MSPLPSRSYAERYGPPGGSPWRLVVTTWLLDGRGRPATTSKYVYLRVPACATVRHLAGVPDVVVGVDLDVLGELRIVRVRRGRRTWWAWVRRWPTSDSIEA
ncbi:MAG: hypothetical protein GY788_29275 [bacterium]|nr:hypothetical protein [bacterium]